MEKEHILGKYREAVKELQNYLFKVDLPKLEQEVKCRRTACIRVGVDAIEITKVAREETEQARKRAEEIFGIKNSAFNPDHADYYLPDTYSKPNATQFGTDFPHAPPGET